MILRSWPLGLCRFVFSLASFLVRPFRAEPSADTRRVSCELFACTCAMDGAEPHLRTCRLNCNNRTRRNIPPRTSSASGSSHRRDSCWYSAPRTLRQVLETHKTLRLSKISAFPAELRPSLKPSRADPPPASSGSAPRQVSSFLVRTHVASSRGEEASVSGRGGGSGPQHKPKPPTPTHQVFIRLSGRAAPRLVTLQPEHRQEVSAKQSALCR